MPWLHIQEDFTHLAPSLVASLASLQDLRLGSHCSLTQEQTHHLLLHLSLSTHHLTNLSTFDCSPATSPPPVLAKALTSLHSVMLTLELGSLHMVELFTVLAQARSSR